MGAVATDAEVIPTLAVRTDSDSGESQALNLGLQHGCNSYSLTTLSWQQTIANFWQEVDLDIYRPTTKTSINQNKDIYRAQEEVDLHIYHEKKL
eukprot:5422317-Amphidinium_carterae.1